QAGYKTGLYTSPHLNDFRERIRINGMMITEEEVCNFVIQHSGILEKIKPSFFEMTVAMAFEYFARNYIDIAVVEVGMGGRLDSTNIITPLVSVITNIGYDHTQFLGETLPELAAEKAGIIKPEVPVVIGENHPETLPVFIKHAMQLHSPLVLADNKYNAQIICETETFTEYCVNDVLVVRLDLLGHYQKMNLQTVLCTIDQLKSYQISIQQTTIESALSNVQKSTGLRGRWQILQHKPLVVADTAHNAEGLHYTMKQIALQQFNRLHMIVGVVNDKDVAKILPLLPGDASYYFTKASIPRALPENELQQRAHEFGLHGVSYSTVLEAYCAALSHAEPEDMIYVGGSSFVVAELKLF
ncbi:MAG TPA: Mur ligase family protein, partial [Bacteroidales bacterium]|nr:Mur ligase family protein [Bacteroidales bacterium]